MLNFCTLFDSHYLSRGVAMHQSLKQHCPDFHLYIFPFDDDAYDLLKKMDLDHVTLVSMKEFENEELLKVKPTRTRGEYCWTCTPSILYHCINNFHLTDCTYLDADLFFYSNPSVLLQEIGNNSILITEHRYTHEYDHSEINGIYCVQFITFKNDPNGMRALTWWRDRCLEWCYNRFEDGKFGDQKYLDDWTTRFEGVHVLKHLGGGVAPWNVQQYKIERKGNSFTVSKGKQGRVDLVFFHFHWVKFMRNNKVDLGCYILDFPYVHDIYKKWIQEVISVEERLDAQYKFRIIPQKESFIGESKASLAALKRKIKGTYLIVDLKTFDIHGQAH